MSKNDENDINPYAAPETSLIGAPVGASAGLTEQEAIRRKYLNHEASVKSVGSLQILGGIIFLVFAGLVSADPAIRQQDGGILRMAVPVLQAVLLFCLGFGLSNLQNWARWLVTAFIGIGFIFIAQSLIGNLIMRPGGNNQSLLSLLIVFGVIILINGYIIYLMVSPKASVVFSSEYKEVIKATPHIKYKTSCLVKGLLYVLLAVFLLGIVGMVLRSLSIGR